MKQIFLVRYFFNQDYWTEPITAKDKEEASKIFSDFFNLEPIEVLTIEEYKNKYKELNGY